MSTLIIGGLFVVALVALVALVFVLRSESATPKAASIVQSVPVNPPNSATQDVMATSQIDTSAHRDVSSPSMTATTTVPTSEPTDEPHFAMANGQFHELTIELHTLHEQSQEIEHRLSILSEMIERIERSQDAHIAEEYSSLIDRQAAN